MKNKFTPKPKVTFVPRDEKFLATFLPESNSYRVKFPYDRNRVELIKRIIPSDHRRYISLTHEWIITKEYFDKIQKYYSIKIVDEKEFEEK